MPDQAISQDSLIGLQFGHYCIQERVGSGGMGVVYRGYDAHLEREVAIKVLNLGTIADDLSRKRFRNEAHALSKLNHPNVATVHDFDTQDGRDFLVMEYIPGVNLPDKLASGPLPEEEVLRLAVQLCDGLAAAHEHGVIHRDLKPGNLRLTPDDRLKILDFGIAKLRQPYTEEEGTAATLCTEAFAGTLPYMAPEQLTGEESDARTDIHAVGLILYEMATGQRPFCQLRRRKLFGAILNDAPLAPSKLNPRVSPGLERIVKKCLEKDPANRYQSARELSVDLRRLQREFRAETIILDHTPPASASLLRNRSFLAAVAALVLLSSLTTIFFFFRSRNILPYLFSRSPKVQSIAVLPLVNLSGDPDREFFADGITEELITQLGKSTGLRVTSRQSVMQFKHTSLPLSEIARKLDVDAVVEGSVLQSGNRVRVITRLVPALSEKPMWAEQYDRDLRDVIALQAEVTQAIVSEIRVTLSPEERARLASIRAVNPEAYEAYLKGRFYWYQVSKSGYEQAEQYFQLALEKDPSYALAYCGLSDVWLMRTDTGYVAPSQTLEKAKSYALKALELDPALAEPHLSLGNIAAGYEHDWLAAERHYQRAIQVNPSSAIAHFLYADLLISLKRNQEWQSEIHRAISLDPMNYFQLAFYGWHLIYVGRYDEAIENLKNVLTTNPNFSSAHMGLWGAYFRKHMDKEAFAEALRFFEVLNDHEAVAALRTGFAARGYREAMKRAGDVLAARSQNTHVPAVRIARLYAHAAENDLAISWLEKAADASETPLEHLAVGWDWEALHPDPRFQALLRRLNLPQ